MEKEHGTRIVFPASAGMIPMPFTRLKHIRCVPRKRGDDPIDLLAQLITQWCSPQARG